jgi:hypothetical protein
MRDIAIGVITKVIIVTPNVITVIFDIESIREIWQYSFFVKTKATYKVALKTGHLKYRYVSI